MKKQIKKIIGGWLAIVLLLFISSAVMAEEEGEEKQILSESATVTGTVNNLFQLLTDEGEAYFIDEGKIGDQLVEKVGARVIAKGKISQVDGETIITVTSFQLLVE